MSALKKNEGFKKRQSAVIEKPNSNPSPTLYLPFRPLPHLSQATRGETDATLTTTRAATDLVNQLCLQSSPFEAREN
ncbi:hypothetical protein PENSUB_576 [Penicillium subrubescens]|uniref:Uncharacterized protein n=1 Tax=Penicillium subrubescens TaxID=1316194 RepID=A0A1Q5UMP6_9EURO|nr:hypothetical protein PENSUB_576 [Penicillium subrubescens]